MCCATPLRLKERFGGGHVLELRCAERSEEAAAAASAWLARKLPQAHVTWCDGAAGRIEASLPR